jgi:hypothetical protein
VDPDRTYADFLDALAGGDPEVASHRLDDLADWICRGGFAPAKPRTRDISAPELARLLSSAAVVLDWAAKDLQREGETE